MPNRAGVGLWLSGIGLLGMLAGIRIVGWYRSHLAGWAIGTEVVIEETVRQTASNCIISSKGWKLWVPRAECERAELMTLQLGEKVRLASKCEPQLIGAEYGNKFACIVKKVVTLPGLNGWWAKRWLGLRSLSRLRHHLIQLLQYYLPQPEAGLMSGIVLGSTEGLSERTRDLFQRTGTLHVMAASGYNVTVVMGLVLAFSIPWFGRRAGLMAASGLIGLYVMLAGGSPPIMRAGLMAEVMLFGLGLGRNYQALWVLFVVSIGLLILEPWLIVSVSYYLSLTATIGVLVGTRPCSHWLGSIYRTIPKHGYTSFLWNRLRNATIDVTATSIAATVATIPISLLVFGSVSLWGLVVSPLLLWLVPGLTYLGLLLLLAGIIWLPAGVVFAWAVWPLSWLFMTILRVFDDYASGIILPFNGWMALGWWSVWLGLWHYAGHLRRNTKDEVV